MLFLGKIIKILVSGDKSNSKTKITINKNLSVSNESAIDMSCMNSSRKLSNQQDSDGEDEHNLTAELINLDEEPISNPSITLKKIEEIEKTEESSPRNRRPEKQESTRISRNLLNGKYFKGFNDESSKKPTDFKKIINESDFENLDIYKSEINNFGGNM